MRGGWCSRGSPHNSADVIEMVENTHKREDRFVITHQTTTGRQTYSISLSAEDVPELVLALEKGGRVATGYTIEAFLIALSESGDPPWARELDFDSEASRCTVRCARREPLRRLADRLARRLANQRAARRLVE